MAAVVNADQVQNSVFTDATKARKKEMTPAEEAQHRFLTLLTTQMQNQDPMSPMENAEVTSQMAQINTVSGITKLQDTIETLSETLRQNVVAGQSAQAASLIGRQVLVPGSTMVLANGQATAAVDLPTGADKVTVEILDQSGSVVSTDELGVKAAGQFSLNWDGKDDHGNTMQDGAYRFRVTALQGGEQINASTMAYATVSSVKLGADGVKLDLGARGVVALADVSQIK